MLCGKHGGKEFGGGTLKIFLAAERGSANTGRVVKTRWKVLVGSVAFAVLAAVLWNYTRPLEPHYQGKPLSQWLKSVEYRYGAELSPIAQEAIRQIGTNALPFLLAELQARDLPQTVGLRWIGGKVPWSWFHTPAQLRRFRAIEGLSTLGPMAMQAIPKLRDLMFGPDAEVAVSAHWALRKIGGREEFPVMMCGLTNLNIVCDCILYFSSLRSQALPAVPALITNLSSAHPSVRKYAALSLGRIGLLPQLVVPALTPLVSDTNRDVRLNAMLALAAYGQEAASALPALQAAATDPDKRVCMRAKWVLQYGVVLEKQSGGIVRGSTKEKSIALAFTGHEFAEGGEAILGELAKHEAKASFFFTGDFLANASFQPIVQRTINDGHLLGPHSDRHLLYCSWEADRTTLVTQEQFDHDVEANCEKIQKAVDRLADRKRLGYPQPLDLEAAFRKRYGLAEDTHVQVVETNIPYPVRYFLPAYEHYNRQIADWTADMGMTLINYTPGTRSNADYTGEADKNFVSSQAIFDSILKKEREDPNGLNGFILLLHIGAGPGRADKFHTRFGELLDALAAKGYQFVRVDELLEPKETK